MIALTDEERRRAWEAGRTDVAAVARRADTLVAETKRVAGSGGGFTDADVDALLADVKSGSEGRRLGRQFNHDPFECAAALGLTVHRLPDADLQLPDRPLVTVMGTLWNFPGVAPVCGLAASLNGQMTHLVMAHELAHLLGFAVEEDAWRFARAFMTVDNSELPGAAWRALQAGLSARERQRSISHHRALQSQPRRGW